MKAVIQPSLVARTRPLLITLAACVLAACSSSPDKPEPTPLAPLTAIVPARQAWVQQVGDVHAPLMPAAVANRVFVATTEGSVVALDAGGGQVLWRATLGQTLSAGVGSDGEAAAVVTRDNDLVLLRQGQEAWRARLTSRSFTPPLVAGGRVFVLGGDRSVSAFDADTGARLWTQAARGTGALVLQQAGVLLPQGNTLVVGFSGRLTGLDPDNGRLRWEAPVAAPRGSNEIERLVDLVAPVSRVGTSICARAYQSAVGCVDTAQGSTRWTQAASASVGVSGDDTYVFGVESNGRVQAWKRDNGEAAWVSQRLLHRGLSAPVALGKTLALGDAQGYVHLLSRDDGTPANRFATDGSAIVGAPLLAGQTLVAVTAQGGVYAWRPQ